MNQTEKKKQHQTEKKKTFFKYQGQKYLVANNSSKSAINKQ